MIKAEDGESKSGMKRLKPDDIRSAVNSFWLNSLEAELLACIALVLADISECLHAGRGYAQGAGCSAEQTAAGSANAVDAKLS